MLLFTISFLLNLLIAASEAPPKCNGTILLNYTDTNPKPHTIKQGFNYSFPGFDSNKVFLLKISKRSKNRVVITLDGEYYITGIGIRQRFNDSEVGKDLCPSSLIYDPAAHFKVTYDHSEATNLSLDYPPGTEKGLIVPNLLFPTQAFGSDYGKENKLRVAINATRMKSISITKKAFVVDNILLNPGTFCVQYELYGCSVTTEISQLRRGIVLEYQFVEPYVMDTKYSGLCSGGVCTGGVGRLTDNEIDAISVTSNSFVIWDLNRKEYSNASNVDNSSIRILIILNDIYLIEQIEVVGTRFIGSETYGMPCMTMVNGASFISPNVEDFYKILLYPLIITNSLFLEFFIDDMESSSKIALAEIKISAHPVPTDNIPQVCTSVYLIAYSLVVFVVVIFLLLSLGLNFYFFIRSKSKLSNFLPRFSLTPMHQPSETNHYMHGRHVDNQPDYESVDMSDRALPNPPEPEPEPETESEPESDPFQTPTPSDSETKEDNTTLFRSLGSVVQMAPNPTYVASLSTLEEIRDYSHLDFSELRGDSVPSQEGRAAVSAKERRVSFSEQLNLSDLK